MQSSTIVGNLRFGAVFETSGAPYAFAAGLEVVRRAGVRYDFEAMLTTRYIRSTASTRPARPRVPSVKSRRSSSLVE
jgi:hypothetical protein